MTCDECRSLLQDLVDAELSNSERFALEAHMTTCVECARLHRHLAKFTTAMVKTLEPIRAGEDFASKVAATHGDTAHARKYLAALAFAKSVIPNTGQ